MGNRSDLVASFLRQTAIGSFNFRSMEGIVVKGNRVYSIEGNALEGNYKEYAPRFKTAINSLYLL